MILQLLQSECLNDIPILQIRQFVTLLNSAKQAHIESRYANRSARYIDAYSKGLTGADVIWANQKYRRHHTLPANILSEIKKAQVNPTTQTPLQR